MEVKEEVFNTLYQITGSKKLAKFLIKENKVLSFVTYSNKKNLAKQLEEMDHNYWIRLQKNHLNGIGSKIEFLYELKNKFSLETLNKFGWYVGEKMAICLEPIMMPNDEKLHQCF